MTHSQTSAEAGAETIALAEGLGPDPSLFFQAIEGGALDLPYLRMKGQAIAERDFAPPLLDLIARRLHEGAAEHGDEDFSATYLTSAPGRPA
jgi:3-hydroxyisobutyrate dehydrogenase